MEDRPLIRCPRFFMGDPPLALDFAREDPKFSAVSIEAAVQIFPPP